MSQNTVTVTGLREVSERLYKNGVPQDPSRTVGCFLILNDEFEVQCDEETFEKIRFILYPPRKKEVVLPKLKSVPPAEFPEEASVFGGATFSVDPLPVTNEEEEEEPDDDWTDGEDEDGVGQL